MAGATVFDATIKAVDGARSVLKSVAGNVAALSKAVRGVAKASDAGTPKSAEFFNTIAALSSVAQHHVNGLRGAFARVTGSLTGLFPVLGALGAGGSLVGLFALTKSVSDASVAADAMTKKLGISGKELGGLAYAAKVHGVDVDALTKGLGNLNRNVGLMVAGKNKELAGLFKQAGISLRDQNGHVRSAAELMPLLSDAFNKTTDPAIRAAAAQAAFGKAGREMLPILMETSAELKQLTAAGARLSYGASDSEKQGMKDFQRNMIDLEGAVGGFRKEVGSKLAPVLAPIIALVTNWVLVNRDWIATGIANKVAELAKWLDTIDINDVITSMTGLVKHTWEVVDSFGGMKTVIGAVMLAMGSPLINAMSGVVAAFSGVIGILRTLAVVALANPFLTIAGLLAGAAVMIYENWGNTGHFFLDLWTGVTATFDQAWSVISGIWDKMRGAVSWISDNAISKWFGGKSSDHPAAASAESQVPSTVAAAAAAAGAMSRPPPMRDMAGAARAAQGSPRAAGASAASMPPIASMPQAAAVSAVARPPPMPDLTGAGRSAGQSVLDDLAVAARSAAGALREIFQVARVAGPPGGLSNAALAGPAGTGASPAPVQSLYRSSGAAPRPAQEGVVTVNIAMTGAPPGTKVSSDTRGIAEMGATSIGWANPAAAY